MTKVSTPVYLWVVQHNIAAGITSMAVNDLELLWFVLPMEQGTTSHWVLLLTAERCDLVEPSCCDRI